MSGAGAVETADKPWALTAERLRAWVETSKPGESIVYAQGYPDLNGLHRTTGVIAARELYDEGRITLTTRKLSAGARAYIAQRLPGSTRPAPQLRVSQPQEEDPEHDALAELMKVLRRIVAAGRVCPTNRELGQMIGGLSPDQAAYLLRKAQSKNRIKIEALDGGTRIVTIVSSGRRTARPS